MGAAAYDSGTSSTSMKRWTKWFSLLTKEISSFYFSDPIKHVKYINFSKKRLQLGILVIAV